MRKVLWSERFCVLKMTEAIAQRWSVKKLFLQTSQNSHKITCAKFCFQRLKPATLWKKRLCSRVFQWILRICWEYLFFQNTCGGCFCNEICLWGKWNPSIKTEMVLFLTRVFLITNSLKVVYCLSKMRLSITAGLSFCH